MKLPLGAMSPVSPVATLCLSGVDWCSTRT
ncbi:hypothetical protein [Enterobacter wuhouensis]